MLADIATGHTWGADICFLIAVILGGLAALSSTRPTNRAWHEVVWAPLLGWAAVALTAAGLLIL